MNKLLLAAMAMALTAGPVNAQIQCKVIEPVAKKSNLFPEGNFKLNKTISKQDKQSRAGKEEGVPFSVKTLSNMPGWDRNIYEADEIGKVYEQVFGKPLRGNKLQVATVYDPALLARFNGNKITKINTKIGPNCKDIRPFILNVETGEEIWSGKKLSAVHNTSSKSKDVSFDCDYVIDQNVLIVVGFEVVAKSSTTTVPVANNAVSNGLLVGDGEKGFFDLSLMNDIVAYIDCETEGEGGLRNNDVNVLGITGGRFAANQEYGTLATFINYGATPANKVGLSYVVDGKEITEEVSSDQPIPYMAPVQLSLSAASPEKGGFYQQDFTINKVNGVDDEYTETNVLTQKSDNTTSNILVSIPNPYGRTVVMEQMTATWCGWCPRGHVAIEKAAKAYPNDFIGIAVHAGDKLSTSDYNPLVGLTQRNAGFPSALLNRVGFSFVDPYYGAQGPAQKPGEKGGDILNDIKMIKDMPSEVKVGLSSKLDDAGSNVLVKSNMLFNFDVPGKYYSVAYVLLENGVRGFAQANYYSKENGKFQSENQIAEDDLKFLFNERKMYTPTYNFVARTIKDIEGIVGSLDEVAFKAGEAFSHDYTLPIPATVKDKKNLDVAVLLLDKFTGEILTAAKVKVGETSTGVESVKADAAEIAVVNGVIAVKGNGTAALYTVDGKKVSSVAVNGSASISTEGLSGVYVVRVVNGSNVTVKKVLL